MKKIIPVSLLSLGMFAQGASAATLSWVTTPVPGVDTVTLDSVPAPEILTGSIVFNGNYFGRTDTWEFSVSDASPVTTYFNFLFAGFGSLLDSKLDGSAIASGTTVPLTVGNHTLALTFDAEIGSQENVTLKTTENAPPIPLPAAAWLFGTALLGLGGLGRKKES